MNIPISWRVSALWVVATVLFVIALLPLLILVFSADGSDGIAVLVQLFVNESVDAPDNWALAFHRSAIFFGTFAGCAAVCTILGLWQHRKHA